MEHRTFMHYGSEEDANKGAAFLRDDGWTAEVTRDPKGWLVTGHIDTGPDENGIETWSESHFRVFTDD